MLRLVPMRQPEFEAFLEHSVPLYAESKVRAGNWDADEAMQRAGDEFLALLPQGLATPDHHLYSVVDPASGAAVGTLWLAESPGARRAAYVYDIHIDEGERGKGFGEQTMRAAEAEALRLGLTEIKLHVFADNQAARALYTKLGYAVTNLNMSKLLAHSKGPGS